MSTRAIVITTILMLCVLAPKFTRADEKPPAPPGDLVDVSKQMSSAASAFLNTLSPDQSKRATYEFSSDERLNWAFVPKNRNGIPFKDLSDDQRKLAMALLKTGLSARGYEKADSIMNQIELVLREIEHSDHRDSGLYYITLFGKPGENATWGWRIEGHHVAFNFTIVDGKMIAAAPNFLGSNPATVRDGPHKGLRVLGAEEDLGRKLVTSLSDDQRKLAVISETAPRDITTSNSRKITPGAPAGIAAEKLTSEQKQTLMDLVNEFVNRLRPELAAQDLKKINDAGADKIHFAWAGGVTSGEGHYYRIQGPTFMIEYDNTQNNANHIHAVWRDPANDFGEDLLKKHYEEMKHDHQ
jgi:hypothetical protein